MDIKTAKRPFERKLFAIKHNNDVLRSTQGKKIEIRGPRNDEMDALRKNFAQLEKWFK